VQCAVWSSQHTASTNFRTEKRDTVIPDEDILPPARIAVYVYFFELLTCIEKIGFVELSFNRQHVATGGSCRCFSACRCYSR
jgi:hypothetical protein